MGNDVLLIAIKESTIITGQETIENSVYILVKNVATLC